MALVGDEAAHGSGHSVGHLTRGELGGQIYAWMQHRQVADGQLGAFGDRDGVAAELHRELRCANDRSADALAGIENLQPDTAAVERLAESGGERRTEIVETFGLPTVDVLGDAA